MIVQSSDVTTPHVQMTDWLKYEDYKNAQKGLGSYTKWEFFFWKFPDMGEGERVRHRSISKQFLKCVKKLKEWSPSLLSLSQKQSSPESSSLCLSLPAWGGAQEAPQHWGSNRPVPAAADPSKSSPCNLPTWCELDIFLLYYVSTEIYWTSLVTHSSFIYLLPHLVASYPC